MTTNRFPSTILDTPAGRLHVWATSGTHVGIRTEGYADGTRQRRSYDESIDADTWDTIAPTVTLSRVEYMLRIDVHPAGTFAAANADRWMKTPVMESYGWEIGDAHDLYLSRVRSTSIDSYGTPTARKQAAAKVFVALTEWLATDQGRAFVADAAARKATADRDSAAAQVETARAALADAEARLNAVTRATLADAEARLKAVTS